LGDLGDGLVAGAHQRDRVTAELGWVDACHPEPPLDGVAANCRGVRETGSTPMLAHAFLVVAALTDQARDPAPSGLITLTCNEVQRLFAALPGRPTRDLGHPLRWPGR